MIGLRRKARALALQILYEVDTTDHKGEEILNLLMDKEELSENTRQFTFELVIGVIKNKDKIDENIQNFAPAWPINQMPVIDRNILRLAIFEILLNNKVPTKVAINEAVELAKTFGSDNSSKFVNGVLGSVSNLTEKLEN
ncbi:transcription antitermination factor NusB [Chloroflexota bacterium]